MAKLQKHKVRRHAERGHYDPKTIHAIIDEAYVCQVAAVRDGLPVIIPTLHARIEDTLYLHGAVAAGIFKDLSQPVAVAVSITLLDGLVLARSLYNHSANYRSVVAFGTAREVTDAEEKLAALQAFSDRVARGRWDDARTPNAMELKRTRVFAIPLNHASAKIRSGPPSDDAEDMDRPTWAGIIPMAVVRGQPVQDPAQDPGVSLPSYLLE